MHSAHDMTELTAPSRVPVGTTEGQESPKQKIHRKLSLSWKGKRMLSDPRGVRVIKYAARSGNVVTGSSADREPQPRWSSRMRKACVRVRLEESMVTLGCDYLFCPYSQGICPYTMQQ